MNWILQGLRSQACLEAFSYPSSFPRATLAEPARSMDGSQLESRTLERKGPSQETPGRVLPGPE